MGFQTRGEKTSKCKIELKGVNKISKFLVQNPFGGCISWQSYCLLFSRFQFPISVCQPIESLLKSYLLFLFFHGTCSCLNFNVKSVEVWQKEEKKFMQIVTQWPGFMDILCIDQLIFYSDMMAKNWEIRRTHSLKQ